MREKMIIRDFVLADEVDHYRRRLHAAIKTASFLNDASTGLVVQQFLPDVKKVIIAIDKSLQVPLVKSLRRKALELSASEGLGLRADFNFQIQKGIKTEQDLQLKSTGLVGSGIKAICVTYRYRVEKSYQLYDSNYIIV